jgi:hypothetical protein
MREDTMATVQNNLEHLEWAVQSRARNQMCALKLLTLFEKHEDQWKTKKLSRAAQELIAVSFSLWRAAFLAEKTGRRRAVFDHGRKFLQRLVEDNAIAYPQDKDWREWTFNYYTRSARASLQQLAKFWQDVVPEYKGRTRKPKDRWDYCQELLDTAVANFEKLLMDKKAKEKAKANEVQKARAVRDERRWRRRRVRALALASRK